MVFPRRTTWQVIRSDPTSFERRCRTGTVGGLEEVIREEQGRGFGMCIAYQGKPKYRRRIGVEQRQNTVVTRHASAHVVPTEMKCIM